MLPTCDLSYAEGFGCPVAVGEMYRAGCQTNFVFYLSVNPVEPNGCYMYHQV
jgi:hypothetical protein